MKAGFRMVSSQGQSSHSAGCKEPGAVLPGRAWDVSAEGWGRRVLNSSERELPRGTKMSPDGSNPAPSLSSPSPYVRVTGWGPDGRQYEGRGCSGLNSGTDTQSRVALATFCKLSTPIKER